MEYPIDYDDFSDFEDESEFIANDIRNRLNQNLTMNPEGLSANNLINPGQNVGIAEGQINMPLVCPDGFFSAPIVYYDIIIPGGTAGNQVIQAYFQQQNNPPLLEHCDEYYLSIIRFSLPGNTIPLLIFPILNGQSNPLMSSLSVTMSYNQYSVTVPLTFYPGANNVPIPPAPIPFQDYASPFYFVYSYQHMLDMYNIALADALSSLNAVVPGGLPAGALIKAPYFYYNQANGLIDLYTTADTAMGNTNYYAQTLPYYNVPEQTPNTVCIFTDPLGFNYFTGMQALNYFSTSQVATYQFLVKDNNNNHGTATGDLILYQEFPSWGNWTSLATIDFSTTQIPIDIEFVPVSNTNSNQILGNTAFKPILTDFVPDTSLGPGAARSRFVYNPTAEYRLVNMNSKASLSAVDLTIFWTDKFGVSHPYLIAADESLTVKFMFIRKDFYHGREEYY